MYHLVMAVWVCRDHYLNDNLITIAVPISHSLVPKVRRAMTGKSLIDNARDIRFYSNSYLQLLVYCLFIAWVLLNLANRC